MVDIQPRTVETQFDPGSPWLVHVDRKFNESITLDLTAFANVPALLTEARPGGYPMVKSGVRLARLASGLYGPATDATTAADFRGHLFEYHTLRPGATRTSAALMVHGTINAGAVPGGAPTTAQRASVPLIRYTDHF